MSAYEEQLAVMRRTEELNVELEGITSSADYDADRMSSVLDEMEEMRRAANDLDIKTLDKRIDVMMPELGFGPEDNDRLVASYR